jgi:hypothetical protein
MDDIYSPYTTGQGSFLFIDAHLLAVYSSLG